MKRFAFLVSLALIFVIPWENAVMIASVGTMSRLVGLFAAAIWILAVVIEGQMRRLTWFHALATAFVAWSAISLYWSRDPATTVRAARTFVQLLVFAYMIWDLYPTATAIRAALQVYVLGAWLSILSVLANYLSGSTVSYNRYSVQGFNAGDAALVLALGLPIAWGLGVLQHLQRRGGMLRWINLAYFPFAVLAIALTGTRMALIATIPSICFLIWSLSFLRRRQRLFVGLLAMIGMAAVLPMIPAGSVDRFLTSGGEIAAGTLGGRGHIWRMGILTFAQHPFLGVGAGAFKAAVGVGNVAHNTFLSVLTELGLVGFALFTGWAGFAVAQIRKHPPLGTGFWLTLLAVWALGASTLTLEVRKVTWLVVALTAASGNVVEARLQVVGVKAHTASARVIHLRDDVVHQGVVVQLAKKMD